MGPINSDMILWKITPYDSQEAHNYVYLSFCNVLDSFHTNAPVQQVFFHIHEQL